MSTTIFGFVLKNGWEERKKMNECVEGMNEEKEWNVKENL